MKKSRCSEEQIIGILKQGEAGVKDGGVVPGARNFDVALLRLQVPNPWDRFIKYVIAELSPALSIFGINRRGGAGYPGI